MTDKSLCPPCKECEHYQELLEAVVEFDLGDDEEYGDAKTVRCLRLRQLANKLERERLLAS